MKIPKPEEGLVINYSYLWKHEADKGREEGRKDRPCAVVLAAKDDRVVVAPITHTPPEGGKGIEIPLQVKNQLGLDHERSWLITNEVNHFKWPGPDLRPINRNNPDQMTYGKLPPTMTKAVKERIVSNARTRSLKQVDRDEGQTPQKREPEKRQSARDIMQEQRDQSRDRGRGR